MELPLYISIIISAAVSVGYTLFGGLYSVAYTDVIQLICMIIGLSLAIFVVILKNNIDISEAFETSNLPNPFPPREPNEFLPADSLSSVNFYSWAGEIKTTKVSSFVDKYLLCLMGGIPWQVYFQRVLSCDTPKNAQILSFVGSLGCLIMIIPAMFVGFIARVVDWSKNESYTKYLFAMFEKEFPDEFELVFTNSSDIDKNDSFSSISPDTNDVFCNVWNVKQIVDDNYTEYSNVLPKICGQSDMILPLLLQHMTNKVVAAIGIGTISAAVMSSADSSILSCSSMLARNVYKIAIRPNASEKEILIILKICIVICGSFATFMACSIPSIMYLFILCSDLVYTVLFPQLLLTVHFSKYCNGYGAYAGFLMAFLLRVFSGGLLSADHKGLIDWGENVPFRTVIMLVNLSLTLIVSQVSSIIFSSDPKLIDKYDFLGVECLAIEDDKRSDDMLSKNVIEFEKRRELLNLAPIRSENNVILTKMKTWESTGVINEAADLS